VGSGQRSYGRAAARIRETASAERERRVLGKVTRAASLRELGVRQFEETSRSLAGIGSGESTCFARDIKANNAKSKTFDTADERKTLENEEPNRSKKEHAGVLFIPSRIRAKKSRKEKTL